MIELPEAKTIASQMNKEFVGRVVDSAEAAHTKHGFAFYEGDPALYGDLLKGKRVDGARAEAGRVILDIGDMSLTFFDGVNFYLMKAGEKWLDKHQLMLEFDDGSRLFCTVQMYAGLMLQPKGAPGNFYAEVAHAKPSPLSDEFDYEYFCGLFEGIKQSLSAKALLATEQRIPGLGNGVLQDILWNAEIHPKTKALTLTEDQRLRLFNCVKSTLGEMAALGGRDTEKNLYGQPGGYHTILSSKTIQWPCRRCGGGITRQAYLGGNVYFCAQCQK